MTNPDTTVSTAEPAPAALDEVSIAEDVHVIVFFVGSPRPFNLMLPAAEADTLVKVTSANGVNRPDSVVCHDSTTEMTWTITADMICAVSVPTTQTRWQLLLDAAAEQMWEFCDLDMFPREGREVHPTQEDGFQVMLTASGPTDRPPAWLRRVARGALDHGVRYHLARVEL